MYREELTLVFPYVSLAAMRLDIGYEVHGHGFVSSTLSKMHLSVVKNESRSTLTNNL
jgi:hypothetical protein